MSHPSPPTPQKPNVRHAQPAANAAQKSSPINVEFVLHVLRQWWLVAAPTGLLLAALAGTVVFVQFKPKYEAKRLFWIDEATPYMVFESEQVQSESKNFVTNQLSLMRS